ncbi:MAG: CaiB/BaiF CoA-transferase family protein [Alphaproteobacteria bacterium]|nr:CaiB/BaiF CoA-transferase family protein [Alphaproteobacteria bacterium]
MAADLEGVLVVALEHAVAAPFCTARLADAGARVIKVERPGGDFARNYDDVVHGGSSYFIWLNRGKESVEIDLKDETDRRFLERIVGQADIFVQNLGLGAANRAGFGSADLRERHPRLITCDISGYGEDGPYAAMRAYDLLVQAESGLSSITGGPSEPGRVGISICDIATGATAFGAIMQALYARERTGEGAALKTSLFETITDWLNVPYLHQAYGGAAPKRVGIRHPSVAPYGIYDLGDGSQIVIAIQNEREWARFCTGVLQDPDMAEDPKFSPNINRVKNFDALDRTMRSVFGALPREEAVRRLSDNDIAFAGLNSIADLQGHGQLRLAKVETPEGPVSLIAPPMHIDGQTDDQLRPVPALGQHSQAIRDEFAAD